MTIQPSSSSTDLDFLTEVRDRLLDSRQNNDPTQFEYALEMIGHWIDELSQKPGDGVWIYQDDCFDVGGGGASVLAYKTLEAAMKAHPAISFTLSGLTFECRWNSDLDDPLRYVKQVFIHDAPQDTELRKYINTWLDLSDLTVSSVESIYFLPFSYAE